MSNQSRLVRDACICHEEGVTPLSAVLAAALDQLDIALKVAGVDVLRAGEPCGHERTVLVAPGPQTLLSSARVVRTAGFTEFALGIEERLTPSFPDWHSGLIPGRRRWFRLMVRDTSPRRRLGEHAKAALAGNLSALMMEDIEPLIRAVVRSARQHGLVTVSSCQGHDGAPGHLAVLGGRRAAERMIFFLRSQGLKPGFLSLSSRHSADRSREFRMATADFWLPTGTSSRP